ncbi:MAG: hypothetical protein L6Q95_01935 [Planctomycetes bacterium]|nr:hypothetical protein [Planctomycetota bacterium]
MRRSRLESLLYDYVAGDLDEPSCREVERLIETDPRARELHGEVKAAQDALRLLRERPEPPVAARDVMPGIHAAIAASAFEPKPRLLLEGIGTRYYRRVAVAATILFALTVGYFSFSGGGAAPPPPPRRPSTPTIAKGALELGSRREGISAKELFEAYESSIYLGEPVEPVANVIDIVGSR